MFSLRCYDERRIDGIILEIAVGIVVLCHIVVQSLVREIGDDEAAAEAYTEKIIRKANRYLLKTAKANRDNVLGAEALWGYNEEDPKAMLAILESLSPEMQEHPDIIKKKESLGTALKTEEGYPFVDFTVVQDPDNPETSTVKFSDYIG